jgi:hypothetical protein
MKRSGSKSRTSPAMRQGNAEASNLVMFLTADRPEQTPSQVARRSFPSGVTNPIPVITTLRFTAGNIRFFRIFVKTTGTKRLESV